MIRRPPRSPLLPYTPLSGSVLDPFPPQRSRLRRRRIVPDQTPAQRLEALVVEAGLAAVATDTLAVRLGVAPRRVTTVIADVGDGLLVLPEMLVASAAVTAEAARLADVLRRHHKEHPIDPGMSLQALRAAVGAASSPPPAAVVDAVLAQGVRGRKLEIVESVARLPGWRPAFDARATGARDQVARRVAEAKWQGATVAELERELPNAPVRAVLAHLAREGVVEQMDQERYAAAPALAEFRAALEATLTELGSATPAELRDRLGRPRISRRAGSGADGARVRPARGAPRPPRAHAQVPDPAARVGGSPRRDAPHGRRPGFGPVDSGERRTIVSRWALYRSRLEVTISCARGAADEAVRLGDARARAVGAGGRGRAGRGTGSPAHDRAAAQSFQSGDHDPVQAERDVVPQGSPARGVATDL